MTQTIPSELHQRLEAAVGRTTYRRLGEVTKTHPETVRRYMQGHSPSAEFLTNLCRGMALNANWLLTGVGPMRIADLQKEALNDAQAADLLTAMANSMTGLVDRVDRLERYVQTLETQVRGFGRMVSSTVQKEEKARGTTADGQSGSSTDGDPAARIGRAVAKRRAPDDG